MKNRPRITSQASMCKLYQKRSGLTTSARVKWRRPAPARRRAQPLWSRVRPPSNGKVAVRPRLQSYFYRSMFSSTLFSGVPWPENQKIKSQPGRRPFLETAQTVGDRGRWEFPLRYRSTIPACKSGEKPQAKGL